MPLPESSKSSKPDKGKGKGKATEPAPSPRLPTPRPEETHSEPEQPKGSDLEKAVYDHLRELGLDLEDPLEGFRKVFRALKKEIEEPIDLENWSIPARFTSEGNSVASNAILSKAPRDVLGRTDKPMFTGCVCNASHRT